MVQEAQSVIDQAKAEALQALRERDEARVAVAMPPPGPSPPCTLQFYFGGFNNPPVPITPTCVLPPHHPLPIAPSVSGPTFFKC